VLFGTFVLFVVVMARLHEELRASDARFVGKRAVMARRTTGSSSHPFAALTLRVRSP
jgi:hypothetical protein